jgi:hypothetical protein
MALNLKNQANGHYLSRGTDHLGLLGAKLRDLRGFATLGYELIQNADDAFRDTEDAIGATEISFDVRKDALIVDNNGVFSDCGQVEDPLCPWKEDPKLKHRCDFHRFRLVASGDKREQIGTTGAFGIGFIAVYQITDWPELISRGRHWVLEEDQPEERRIKVCSGCSLCQGSEVPGTRFILPWAQNPESFLRKALRAEIISRDDPTKLIQELEKTFPTAILFLKHLNRIDIRKDGKLWRRIERIEDGDDLIINDGIKDQIWHLFRGDFRKEADQLINIHQGRIEPKRSPSVTLAIPAAPLDKGLLCAVLPTQHETGLPFHINADFFPSSDRKKIIFESDYQSEWNRAAIKAGAEIFQISLDRLRNLLDHKRLWKIIDSIRKVASEAEKGQGERSFSYFWEKASNNIGKKQIFYTTRNEWRTASEVLLFSEPEEEEAIPLCEGMGVSLVHTDLRPYFSLLRSIEIGVQLLDIPHITEGLRKFGLNKRVDLSRLPGLLRKETQCQILWRELAVLLKRRRNYQEQQRLERDLSACSIALGRDMALWPCQEIYQADESTIDLFSKIDSGIPFLKDPGEEGECIKKLCKTFSASAAIQILSKFSGIDFEKAKEEGRLDPARLIRWFEGRQGEILNSLDLKRALSDLPIFPTSLGLKSLSALALPGDFNDLIGIIDLVDISILDGRREFLRDLGARELTFQQYVSSYIPLAFNNSGVPPEKKHAVVRLVAEQLGKIRDFPDIQENLTGIDIIECDDGNFRKPNDAYLTPQVKEILGSDIPIAVIPKENPESIREFYRWLGVSEKPHPSDILMRIDRIIRNSPSTDGVKDIQIIVSHLGERFREDTFPREVMSPLRSMAWLPVRGDLDQWFAPNKVYADFQSYLFETQGTFLDLPHKVQTSCVNLFQFLGINDKPTPSHVVAHLIKCMELNEPVNKEVYRFLNDNCQDKTIAPLRHKACLLLPSGIYVKPSEVFWSDHPFGGFRYKLSPDLRSYGSLFAALQVRENPDQHDAIEVIMEISSIYGSANDKLDDDAYTILINCWQMLSRTWEEKDPDPSDLEEFRDRKVIPDIRHVLNPPDWIFFEDRAGLPAKFGDYLKNNVIPKPQTAWRAMAAAGVRTLSNAVKANMVECEDPIEDDLVLNRLLERRRLLARIFETQKGEMIPKYEILDKLRVVSAKEIKIQYILNIFKKELSSAVEPVPSHFSIDDLTLYLVKRNGGVPWAAMGRELALALCPYGEPGQFASGIKEVLSAETQENANRLLDELGFPLVESSPPPIGDGGYVKELGGGEKPDGGLEPLTPGEAIEKMLGGVPPRPSGMPEELDKLSGGPDLGQGTDHKRKKQRGKLRTYVSTEGAEKEGSVDHPDERDPVDRHGVNHVLEYERDRGRYPEEKPFHFPGYDIESKDSNGNIVRYIEVKATSGEWGSLGAALSKPQFTRAMELGDKYWLYVVECAGQETYRIYRIQDPAVRVNQYIYDDGWKVLKEEED